MKIAITGVRDGLLVIGLAVLLCLFIVGSFYFADGYHIHIVWVYFGLNSILTIPAFVRGFCGHLKRPLFIPFLIGLAIAHGLILISQMKWVPLIYWIPVILAELYAGVWAAHRLFGIVPSGDI